MRMKGAKRENDQRRIRFNIELYQIFEDPEVSKLIELWKLQWAGHIPGTDDTRILEKVYEKRAEGW